MPQSYDPKLGVLSAFEGMGTAASDIGKMGLMDSMETRRSKMEQDLKLQIQGKKQDFEVEQADVESERDIEAATVKHGRDVELAGVKADAKAAGRGKDSDKYELVTATGTPLKYDDVRKAWSNQVGADLESFDPNAAMTFEKYIEGRGIRYRTDKPPVPPKPLDESTYRDRYKQHRPDASQEEIDAAVQKNRASGKITGAVAAPAAEPGIIDAMAADASQIEGNGQFGGGTPQAQPGVLTEAEEVVAPTPDTSYAKMGQAMESDRISSAQRDTIQDRLLKHREKAVKSSRQVGRVAAKKEQKKVEKAAMQVEAALKKGNINQISKDRLKIALNNQSFVDGLSEEELQTLIDYLEQ